MAVAGPTTRTARSSMSLMQGSAQASFYHHHQPPPSSQDLQPDRPIGYGAFGVVWQRNVDRFHDSLNLGCD
ncbi:unnamed protein product [Nezara viridula]|uniref:Uncharacterized protein n=1 Tax=Nezara viridula TaxID=85310 RepID=A0A9P0HBL8_NEZVI|nr:unnamed protein product [Nezara viridula]